MFIEVIEITCTDDGNGVCQKPTLINTNCISRIEAMDNGEGDYDANIIMTDGAEILVDDYRYESLCDLIFGKIESYATCAQKPKKSMKTTNQKIRNAICEKNLSQYEVARLLGFNEYSFCRHLRYELPEDEQNELIMKITALKEST